MTQVIYIEEDAAAHPRTREIFNRKGQNFRLQKEHPALILAIKRNRLVLEAPAAYAIGARRNYYFSTLLNCPFDCRYCFLQGMYRSAHYVIFVNYEDFQDTILDKIAEEPEAETCFFSGYDGDSLAFDPVTGFTGYYLSLFEKHPQAWIELRTKSTQIRSLLRRAPLPNVIVAFSFTPQAISRALEHGVPSLEKRLAAAAKLQEHGWKLGLRFDPSIFHEGYATRYEDLFAAVFSQIRIDGLHSVNLGTFRMPAPFYRNMVRLHPRERLFAGPLEEHHGKVGYRKDIETEMVKQCEEKLLRHIPMEIYFPCREVA